MSEYNDRRRRRRAQIKVALLPLLRRHEQADERPDLAALAERFRCGQSSLRAMRHELAEEGALMRGVDEPNEPGMVPDLEARIAAVRQVKIQKCIPERRTALTSAELAEVLP